MKVKALCTAIVMAFMLISCTQEADEPINVVMTQTVEADTDYSAKTFAQLWEDSDLVAVVSADEISSEIIPGSSIVKTAVTFSSAKVYKGECADGIFKLTGGYMKLKTYSEAVPYLDYSSYSKQDMERGYVCTRRNGTHIPEEKETLLIFAKYAPEEDFYYAFADEKSVLVFDGDSVILEGLISEEDWTDPFVENYTEFCQGTAEKTEDGYVSVVCNWTELENVLNQFNGGNF